MTLADLYNQYNAQNEKISELIRTNHSEQGSALRFAREDLNQIQLKINQEIENQKLESQKQSEVSQINQTNQNNANSFKAFLDSLKTESRATDTNTPKPVTGQLQALSLPSWAPLAALGFLAILVIK